MGLANADIPTLRYGNRILPSEVMGFIGVGNIYYVVNDADTALVSYMQKTFNGNYSDGSQILYVAAHLTSDVAIQAAIDGCMKNRNDYVVILPSDTNYSLTAALTIKNKSTHVICPTGLSGNSFAIGNTARIKQLSANPGVIISAQAVEWAGLYCKNYADQSFIKLYGSAYSGSASSAGSQNIHHNMFPMVVTTNGSGAAPIIAPYNLTNDDGGAWGSIEYNWFISETGTGATIAIACVAINATATGARVCHNEVTIGDKNTATIAISNLAVKGRTDYNTFSESGGASGNAAGGTITKAVTIGAMGAAIENRGAVATTHMLAGGTAAISYSENYDGHDASSANGSVVA